MFSFPACIMADFDLNPESVPNCTFYGMSDLVELDTNGRVSRLIDQSSFGRHLDTFASPASYNVNNLSAMVFDTATSYQGTATFSNWFSSTFTFYLVVEASAFNSNLNHQDGNMLFGGSLNNFGVNVTSANSGQVQHWYRHPTAISPVPRAAIVNTKYVLCGTINSSRLHTLSFNGTLLRSTISQSTLPPAHNDIMRLGNAYALASSVGFNGNFWALITANALHVATVQDNIVAKLKAKYGVT